MYEEEINTIFDKYELNEKANTINAILTKMKQKKLTDKGKECKGRIVKLILWNVYSFAKLKSFYVSRVVLLLFM